VSPGATVKLHLSTGWLFESGNYLFAQRDKIALNHKRCHAELGCSTHSLPCQSWLASPPFFEKMKIFSEKRFFFS